MATTMQSPPAPGVGSPPPPPAAAPPSRSEVERKLSFRSAAPPPAPRGIPESPKKPKKQQQPMQMQMPPNTFSGNDSDTSSITSLSHPQLTSPIHPSSPLLTSGAGSAGGLSAIAERKLRDDALAELDEMELEDVEEEGEDEGEESEEVEKEGGDLQRGMEGERVLKGGYLLKKQERRKAWKRKWFVLRTNKLAYYKDDREYSLKRVLDLKSIQTVAPCVIKKHSFSFGIVTAKRTFLAKASSQDEMDDWVRAINGARRRLSEREEEERNKRSASGSQPVSVPPRAQPEAIDTHTGTYSSVMTSATGGSFTASPIATTGYFAAHPSTAPAPQFGGSPMASPTTILPPASPMDTTNTLTTQMAKMNMNKGNASQSAAPRMPRSVSGTMGRRETSVSSMGSSEQHHQSLGGWAAQPALSSDEDEPYFPDPTSAAQEQMAAPNPMAIQPSPVDPNKVILSAYLMKRSKGRGRKVWRKRWFYLTSQGLTYTKSHMDSRAIRYVPLAAVLDALEFDPENSEAEGSDSDIDDRSEAGAMPRPTRSFSVRGRDAPSSSKRPDKPGGSVDEHLFRIVTAKRTFVLCAPSEEDEIKWLAAFRALLNRQRDWSSDGAASMSPTMDAPPRMALPPQSVVPMITNQPPTPASLSPDDIPTPSVGTSAGPPILERPIESSRDALAAAGSGGHSQQGSQASQGSQMSQGSQASQGAFGGRGRSATYIAKGAVADVVRRFHPEQQQSQGNKELPPAPSA